MVLEEFVELDKQNLSNLLKCDKKADSKTKLDNTMVRRLISFKKIVSNQSTDIVFKTEYTPLLETVFIDQVIKMVAYDKVISMTADILKGLINLIVK